MWLPIGGLNVFLPTVLLAGQPPVFRLPLLRCPFGIFRPAGSIRCTDEGKITTGGIRWHIHPCQMSPLSVQGWSTVLFVIARAGPMNRYLFRAAGKFCEDQNDSGDLPRYDCPSAALIYFHRQYSYEGNPPVFRLSSYLGVNLGFSPRGDHMLHWWW